MKSISAAFILIDRQDGDGVTADEPKSTVQDHWGGNNRYFFYFSEP